MTLSEAGITRRMFSLKLHRQFSPASQAVLKEVWIDKRRSEVIDVPYHHVVFTVPHELNSLIYCN